MIHKQREAVLMRLFRNIKLVASQKFKENLFCENLCSKYLDDEKKESKNHEFFYLCIVCLCQPAQLIRLDVCVGSN